MKVAITYRLDRQFENKKYVYTALKTVRVIDWDASEDVQLSAAGLLKDIGPEKYQELVDKLKSGNNSAHYRTVQDMSEEQINQMFE